MILFLNGQGIRTIANAVKAGTYRVCLAFTYGKKNDFVA